MEEDHPRTTDVSALKKKTANEFQETKNRFSERVTLLHLLSRCPRISFFRFHFYFLPNPNGYYYYYWYSFGNLLFHLSPSSNCTMSWIIDPIISILRFHNSTMNTHSATAHEGRGNCIWPSNESWPLPEEEQEKKEREEKELVVICNR